MPASNDEETRVKSLNFISFDTFAVAGIESDKIGIVFLSLISMEGMDMGSDVVA